MCTVFDLLILLTSILNVTALKILFITSSFTFQYFNELCTMTYPRTKFVLRHNIVKNQGVSKKKILSAPLPDVPLVKSVAYYTVIESNMVQSVLFQSYQGPEFQNVLGP